MSSTRSQPRNSSKHSLPLPLGNRLSIIAEDADVPPAPPVPAKAHHRPFSRRWNIGDPPRHSFEKPPPPYSVWNITGPKGEKLTDVRNNKYIARRGGWKRLLAIAVLFIAFVVAVVTGLIVGLRNRSNSSKGAPSSAGSSPTPGTNPPFPEGSWGLYTFLDTFSTNCSSNPATWACYPYQTYSQDPNQNPTVFSWVIATDSTGGTKSNYMVSSSENPFAVNFNNASMTLVDANTTTERYTFSISLSKTVIPQIPITTNGTQATCIFSDTVLQANLYTKMPKMFPNSSATTTSPSSPTATPGVFTTWPFAVEISQSIGGGSNVPACYELISGNQGPLITNIITPQLNSEMCSCVYKNFDP